MLTPFLKPRPKTEKATEVENNPPAATPLPSVWLPDDDPKPRVNTHYKKVPKEFIEYQKKKSPPS